MNKLWGKPWFLNGSKSRIVKLRKIVIRTALLSIAIFLFIEISYIFLGSNFHTVEAGKVYRSAQLSPENLTRFVKQYGIRTIVNLRGYCPFIPWYRAEAETTCRLDICQEDINLSAGRLPSSSELRQLVEVFDRAEYPLLIHCRRGADRTGLASMMYLLLQSRKSLGTARRQLGLRYGHFPLGKPAQMAEFLTLYRSWLANSQQDHTAKRFRQWVLHEYRAGPGHCLFEKCRRPTEAIRAQSPFALRVRVRNTGSRSWRMNPHKNAGVHLIYRLYDLWGRQLDVGHVGLFDRIVSPGESIDLLASVAPIAEPGRYLLVLDMADGEENMFYQLGSEPLELRLEVKKRKSGSGR